ncbi:unnamed protein product [Penicillium olsonii]|nr:unnamed protein product [Penicillium olsonii]
MISGTLIILLWVLHDSIPSCIHCSKLPSDSWDTPSVELAAKPARHEIPSEDSRSGFQSRGEPALHTQTDGPSPSKSTRRRRLTLPQDYLSSTDESVFCENRFGIPYLESLRDSAMQYCTADSHSGFTCFHSQTVKGRVDSFCLGRNAIFDPIRAKFRLQCELRMLPTSKEPYLIPEYGTFQKYMSETGPRVVMDKWVHLEENHHLEQSEVPKYTIMVKREGATNMWHSLLEAFSMSLTMDVLQITPKDSDSRPFFTPPDTSNTQVVILDDHDLGPYVHIWAMFAERPILRIKDMASKPSFENIILPLAGGSNPLWQSNPPAKGASCEDSVLLSTFSRRVLSHYNISKQLPHKNPDLVMTFIDRAETRVLLNHTEYLQDVKSVFPNLLIKEVDFAAISFKEQLEIVQSTNILVGVHGAGLTHAMFLPPRSTVVEIIPDKVDNKAYQNLASLMGHSYLNFPSLRAPQSSVGIDWHDQQVVLDRAKFTDILNVALKTMYNKSTRK